MYSDEFWAPGLVGYAFRRDGRYFVLAERHRSRDMLGVYDTVEGYKQARVWINPSLSKPANNGDPSQHFTVPTSSLASLAISPTGKHVAVWDGPLEVIVSITIF